MSTTASIIQFIVALTILNVWLFRRDKATSYRGSTANTLREEFQAYGFPDWVYFTVGPLKVLTSILMIAAIWNPLLLIPSTVYGWHDANGLDLSLENKTRQPI